MEARRMYPIVVTSMTRPSRLSPSTPDLDLHIASSKDIELDNDDESFEIPDFHFDWLKKPIERPPSPARSSATPPSHVPKSIASSALHDSHRIVSSLPRRLSGGSHGSPSYRATLDTPSSGDSVSSKSYGARPFQRVVSAPLQSGRAAIDNASFATPATSERHLIGPASTTRRLGGLSRFGGPARRVAVPELEEPQQFELEQESDRK